jgi:hypothetical protein
VRSLALALSIESPTGARQFRLSALHLDDHAGARMPCQHVIEPRHAYALPRN